jgi:hypothetical protein
MHLSIAVLLGIPVFSAVMIIGDSVFLPDAFWLAAGRLVRQTISRVRSSRRWAGESAEPEKASERTDSPTPQTV